MRRPIVLSVSLAVLAVFAVGVAALTLEGSPDVPTGEIAAPADAAPSEPEQTGSPAPAPVPSPPPQRDPHPLVDRSSVGEPWGTVEGVTTFRGNPTRTFYGRGPVPGDPAVAWRYPEGALCMTEQTSSGDRRWCGTGWTGQPLVWARDDGVLEVIVGGYDGAVHFVDGATGAPTRAPFRTGHMVKGTETLDPDGHPLLYTGSRDGYLRVLALDRGDPVELWALEAHPRRVWNNDWDGSPAIVNDVMYVGGEDSWFYAVKLNRGYDDTGAVTVDPEVILEVPGWSDELIAAIGDRNVSIENSVALYEGRVYFANSGGRVVGLDIADLDEAAGRGTAAAVEPEIVFDFWTGDDTDATITIDGEGMLYVAVELQRFLPRAEEVGQLVKLDPYTDGDPVVWSVDVPPDPPPWLSRDDGGIWSTPALGDGVVYVTTHPGDLLAVDATTGEVTYRERIGYHEWASPAVVDGTLVVPLCSSGGLRAYDLSDPRRPVERWTFKLATGGCIESTPVVWDGHIFVGSRDGFLYGLADPE